MLKTFLAWKLENPRSFITERAMRHLTSRAVPDPTKWAASQFTQGRTQLCVVFAEVLFGVTQLRVHDLVRGKINLFSLDARIGSDSKERKNPLKFYFQ